MDSVKPVRCPVCDQTIDRATNRSIPFCSERCRQIDLGRWLRERYSMPIERPEEDVDNDGGGSDEAG